MNARHNSCCYIFPSVRGPDPIVRWAYYHGLILTITAANHSHFFVPVFSCILSRETHAGLAFSLLFLTMSQNERVQKVRKAGRTVLFPASSLLL